MSVGERQKPYDFTCMENSGNKINEQTKEERQTKNRLFTMENKLVVARREVGGGELVK